MMTGNNIDVLTQVNHLMHDMSTEEVIEAYNMMTPAERNEFEALLRTSPPRALMYHQVVPVWETWWEVFLLVGGRGVGKTVTGATEARNHLRHHGKTARIGIGAPTNADARDTCMEGQALWIKTLIPTPNGWTTMEEIKKGDLVFDRQGNIQTVELVSDIKTNRPCYRVEFNDGATIITDKKHKWLTYNAREKEAMNRVNTKLGPQVRTTYEIKKTLRVGGMRNALNHSIPICDPIVCEQISVPIDPYTLGVWLGDGISKSGAICSMDYEIIQEIQKAGYSITVHKQSNCGKAKIYGILGLQKQLRANCLIRNKHIPSNYLRGSLDQRLNLIKGLMDTDGDISDRGQCAFNNTNLELVESLRELLLSCGIKVGSITSKIRKGYKILYRITFTPYVPVFRLSRKLYKQIEPNIQARWRYIKSVSRVKSVPVKCIKVTGPESLYLAGSEFIPTHNTGLITMFPNEFKSYNRSLGEARHISGGVVKAMGTEQPKRWNGPQWSMLWFDELALCNQAAWDDANLGLRLGKRPYAVCTTTPKNRKWVKKLAFDKTTCVPQYVDEETGKDRLPTTFDNKFLPQRRVDFLKNKYGGSRLGRQELEGVFVDDIDGAKWKRDMIKIVPDTDKIPTMMRVIVAVDPAGSRTRKEADINALTEEQRQNQKKNADTAIAVVGLGADGKFYVLELKSDQWGPTEWAAEAIKMFHKHRADKIVAERNFGGDMVENTIRTIDQWDRDLGRQINGRHIPIKVVVASKGKDIRAEPVVTLYEQSRIFHIKHFAEAEDQMCAFIDADENEGADMVDALVWAVIELAGLGMDEGRLIIVPGDPRFQQVRIIR